MTRRRLIADTFVAVITAFGSFDSSKGTARAWVFGIARRIYASYCESYRQQQNKLQRLAGRRDLGPDQVEELLARIDAERGRQLVTGLAALPDRDRAVVELVDLAGLRPNEAAATAGSLVAVSGTPAYALTTNHDGSIRLVVYQPVGVAQANAKLRAIGAKVIVVPVGAGCPSLGSVRKPAVPLSGKGRVRESVSSDGSITVNAQGVPRGDVIVVATEISGKFRETASAITSLPVPHCVSLPTPPAGGSGSGPSGSQSGSGPSGG